MNYSDYRFTLDIQIHQAQVSVPVTFGDSARRLCIGLTDGRKPYVIGDGCRAVFNAKKPDGNVIKNDCIIERNVILYEFTAQTTNSEGIVYCDITLYDTDGKVLTSPQFIIVVDKRVVRDAEVPVSQSEATTISNMIAAEMERATAEAIRAKNERERAYYEDIRGQNEDRRIANEAQRCEDYYIADQREADRYTAENKRFQAEESRTIAEEAREDAEAARAEAEAKRASEETRRKNAESSRSSAETNRKSAETNRQNAETNRQNAETAREKAEEERAKQIGEIDAAVNAIIAIQNSLIGGDA